MTIHFGNVKPGRTLYVPFASFAGSTGASVTISGLAVTDIEIYKDGSVTQRSSDSGYTLLDTDGIDRDGVTGQQGFSISLADNTDAGFYAAGSFYEVWVASVTVDSQTVTFLAATFTIGFDSAVLNTTIATLSSQTSFTLTVGPAEDDAINGCVVYIHDVASAVQGGFAYVSDYTGSTKTVTLAAGTTFTAAATDNIAIFPPVQVFGFGGTAGTFASGRPEVNTTHWGGTAVASATVNSNVTQISGDSTAADNAEAFFDGTGYAGTGNTIPTVTSVTNQVTANVTAISGDTTAADNAEAFFDGTGYAGTNNVIPTVTTTVNLTTNNDKTGYSLAAGGAGSGSHAAAELNNIADAILDRNMATGTDSGSSTVRTPRQALRALRNKVSIAAGTATVTKEDDSTSSWTAAVTTTAGNPISEIDPAGP